MNQPLLGPRVGPLPFTPAQPQRRSSRALRMFIFLWLLAGFAYVVVHLTGNRQQPAKAAQDAAAPIAAGSAEDLLHHMDQVEDKTVSAAASLRRAEDQITQALPVVQRNTLLVETKRLKSALAVIEAARRDLEQSRQDIELIHNTLEKEIQK